MVARAKNQRLTRANNFSITADQITGAGAQELRVQIGGRDRFELIQMAKAGKDHCGVRHGSQRLA